MKEKIDRQKEKINREIEEIIHFLNKNENLCIAECAFICLSTASVYFQSGKLSKREAMMRIQQYFDAFPNDAWDENVEYANNYMSKDKNE